MAQYAINGYEVQALDFMVKPIEYFNFSLKLDKAIRICKKLHGYQIYVPSEQGTVKIDIVRSDLLLKCAKSIIFILLYFERDLSPAKHNGRFYSTASDRSLLLCS